LGFYFLTATNAHDSFLSDVIDYAIDDAPANEIQLSNRRRKPLKLNSFRTTKRVEKLFRIAIQ
jgi:hypothetical protein